MISTFRFSVHKFTDINNLTFSAIEYSKLKYGSRKYARRLGMELASNFLQSVEFQNLCPNLFEKKIVVCSAPWKNIPVASTALKDYFISEFNPIWSLDNPEVEDLKVYREHSYNEDYGVMTKEERERAITSDDFHIDKEFIKGKVLFFIDDIIVTGAHERRIESLLKSVEFEGVVLFLYYAEYQGNDNPAIENELNYAFMKNLADMDCIIKNEILIFNTRLVKFILNSSYYEFKTFIFNQSHCFCSSLKTHIECNEYHKIDEFKENYNQLTLLLANHNKPPIS
ncbi:MAG: phosphoribosyltransferase family protein [Methylococcaceae bacterium]